ncbi:MAG: YbaB/EbfC family nucleoid-associated protein [Pseudonocardia sp.]
MDAQEWLDSYQQRISTIGRRAEQVQGRLAALESTVTSRDGAVTVTVTPGGELRGLVIHELAQRLSRIQLAQAITSCVATARAQAGRAAADALEPLLGEKSAAMTFVRTQLPPMPEETRR